MTGFATLRRAPWPITLRSVLPIVAIVLGVGALIAAFASGHGAREAAIGASLLIVANRTPTAIGGASSRPSLTWTDFEVLENHEVPTIQAVAPVLQRKAQLASDNANWNSLVIGTKPSYFAITNRGAHAGALFDEGAATGIVKVAVLGQTVATQLYGTANPIGQSIRIDRQPFEVIGVLDARGQAETGQDYDDTIVIPLGAYLAKLEGGAGKLVPKGLLYVSVASEDQLAATQGQIAALLRERHHLRPSDDDDFQVRILPQSAKVQPEPSEPPTKLLAIVAVVLLIGGGIGVMTSRTARGR